MAFTATLTNIARVDQALDVEVLYEDSASGFSLRRVLNFNNGDTVTIQDVRAEVIRQGLVYKSALGVENTLKANIGTKITI